MRFLASEQYTYSRTQSLFVHYPKSDKRVGAVILVHGGGWSKGDASWMSSEAKRFTSMGLVAVCINYRLSDLVTNSPLESILDVKDAISWVRSHATKLNINPYKIAIYGASAGAQLALESFLYKSYVNPNAIIVMSPNLSVAHSRWFRRITYKRIDPVKLSPIDNLVAGMPPTLIIHGTADTMAKYTESARFQSLSLALGNYCELYKFNGYGHMLVAPGKDDHTGSSNREAMDLAFSQIQTFLKQFGFI